MRITLARLFDADGNAFRMSLDEEFKELLIRGMVSKNGGYVLAVDDSILFQDSNPSKAFKMVQQCREYGVEVVLWTNLSEEALLVFTGVCVSHGLVFDAINDNAPCMRRFVGDGARKISYDELWDSRAYSFSYQRDWS